jgi:hypothetical protein
MFLGLCPGWRGGGDLDVKALQSFKYERFRRLAAPATLHTLHTRKAHPKFRLHPANAA